ncbi:DUF6479 family protein [Streptomyces minutiscleroticus]|uniref:Secreted protein n=1 Tax=Streptomyces minutiscleroticus TaxID=68238 RepID=A0A918NKR0_9ACTN|nr:DUF6479 family protein [Streptomyces minutiscleroticus]GGX75964.1 hypothetical protein GCM10010358_32920 [Streptomyces minutiscleroticus]
MNLTAAPLALSSDVPFGGLAPFLVGVVVAAVLITAVWWGWRIRSREPAPPRPEDQPRLPESGPVRETRERREPSEMPHGGDRLTPHRMHGGRPGPRPAADQNPPTWDGGSGGFGSGGPGRT